LNQSAFAHIHQDDLQDRICGASVRQRQVGCNWELACQEVADLDFESLPVGFVADDLKGDRANAVLR
jgi:hypothetical protein